MKGAKDWCLTTQIRKSTNCTSMDTCTHAHVRAHTHTYTQASTLLNLKPGKNESVIYETEKHEPGNKIIKSSASNEQRQAVKSLWRHVHTSHFQSLGWNHKCHRVCENLLSNRCHQPRFSVLWVNRAWCILLLCKTVYNC